MPGIISVNSKVTLPASMLEVSFNETLVHQVVTSIMTNARQGTKKQKTRSEVAGGGRKPKSQKGSGGARYGTISSPLFRSGGRAFAARPRNFNQKINKKMYRAAMRSVLAQLAREERLVVIEDIKLEKPSTKQFSEALTVLEYKNALLVTSTLDENVYLSLRNIPNITMATVDVVNPLDLVAHDKVVMTVSAVKDCEEKFA